MIWICIALALYAVSGLISGALVFFLSGMVGFGEEGPDWAATILATLGGPFFLLYLLYNARKGK